MQQSESEWRCVYFLGLLNDCLIFLSCLERFPECFQNVDVMRLNVEFSFVLISDASNIFLSLFNIFSQTLFLQDFVFDHFENGNNFIFFFDFIFFYLLPLKLHSLLLCPSHQPPFFFFFCGWTGRPPALRRRISTLAKAEIYIDS